MDSMIAYNMSVMFHTLTFVPVSMCLIFSIVINAVNEAMDTDVTLDAPLILHSRNLEICTKPVIMVDYIVSSQLYSTRLPILHRLFNACQQLIGCNRDQRFRSIVLDVCSKRLFFQHVTVVIPVQHHNVVLSKYIFTIKVSIKLT